MKHTPLEIAHRGVHTTGALENTLAAFQVAVELGAEMIELDVRRSGADELVILHDHKLKGTSLADVSLDEFERRTGLRPPLLQDVLGWATGRIGLDVELKEDGYVDALAPMLATFHAQGPELLVTSFNENVIAALSDLAPELRTGLLLAFTAEKAAERSLAAGAQVALPEMKIVSEALIESVTAAGLDLIVWDYMPTRHGPAVLCDPRVLAVITDDVAGALAARD